MARLLYVALSAALIVVGVCPAASAVDVILPNIQAAPGDRFVAPILVSDVTDIELTAADLVLTYDPGVVTFVSATTVGAITQGWLFTSTELHGRVGIAMASSRPTSGSGALVFIEFEAPRCSAGATSLTLASVQLNGGVPTTVQDGSITVDDLVSAPRALSEGTAAVVTVGVVCASAEMDSARLFYAEGGNSEYESAPLVAQAGAANTWGATIPGRVVTPRGVLWYVEIPPLTGRTLGRGSATSPEFIRVHGSSEIAIRTMTDGGHVWNLVSSPLSTGSRGAPDTFDTLGGGFLEKWIAWRWSGARQRWESAGPLEGHPTATAAFDIGVGWAVAAVSGDGSGAAEGLVASGASTDARGPAPLPLHAGWNLVGSPYDFPVAWSDASAHVVVGGAAVSPTFAAASGWVDNRLVALDPETQSYVARYSDEAAPYAIEPGRAWWLFSHVDGAELRIAPTEAGVEGRLTAGASPSRRPRDGRGAWSVEFALMDSGGGSDSASLVVGGPADGVGALRHVKPPAPPGGGAPRLAVENADPEDIARWLDRSARALGPELVWSLAASSDGEATLAWSLTGSAADYDITLVDPRAGRVVDLREANSVRLDGSRKPRELVVRARRLDRPSHTRLMANFPNPFNPETWIPFELSAASDVTVSVYTVGGRVVRTLDLGRLGQGVYADPSTAARWDGRNGDGEPASSGVYIYELRAGEHRLTGRMTVLK